MRRISSLMVLLAALLSVPARCQPNSQSAPRPVTLRVQVPVIALQGTGSIDLCRNRLSVIENGKRQLVVSCAPDVRPLALGVLVDSSSSMKPHASSVREILTQVLQDEVAGGERHLFLSAATLQRVVPPPGYNGSLVDLLTVVENKSRTAILDHLHDAALRLSNAPGTRKILVILSDGDDNLSEIPEKKLIETLQRTQVTLVYFLLYNLRDTFQGELRTSKLLMELADATGGALLLVRDSADRARATQALSSITRGAALLSPTSALDGSVRKIKIELEQESGRPPLRLHYRQGYYAPNQ